MSGRDSSRGPGPDDWFAPPANERGQPAPSDDWLGDEASAPGDARRGPGPAERRRVALAVGAIAIVLLVAGLAIGGVFSGGGKSPAAISTTESAPTTNQTPTTTPAPAVLPAPATTLKPGDTGAQVKVLQRALVQLGYPVGKIDGDYGPSTQAAVTSFQRASGLTADGVVGPKTLTALKQALLAQH